MTECRPVVFIHGLWLHASSWDRWVDLFTARGYAAIAPGWPSEEPTVGAARDGSGLLTGYGIGEIREHYAKIAVSLGTRPVLVGNGLGGLLALALAGETHAAGVIAIDAAPVSALPPPGNRAELGLVALDRDSFRAVFGSAVSREDSDRLRDRWAIPAPRQLLREAVLPGAFAPRSAANTANSSRGPVLLVMSGEGRRLFTAQAVPAAPRWLAAATDVVEFPEEGPSLVIDNGWRPVAESCLSWLDAQEL